MNRKKVITISVILLMILQVVLLPTATGPNNLEANYGTAQELDTFFQSVNQRNDEINNTVIDELNFLRSIHEGNELDLSLLEAREVSMNSKDESEDVVANVNDYETVLKIVESSDLYTEGAVIEKYLEDSEDILIGVKNYPKFSVSEIEKPIKNETLFSYSKKYLENGGLEGSERELPANINDDKNNKIMEYVEKINSIIPTRGIFRYDFLVDKDDIYINEINTIPGSHALYLWQNLNISK